MGLAQGLVERYEGILADLGEVPVPCDGDAADLARAFRARWTALHRRALATLGAADAAEELEAEVASLLRRRKALVSASVQALARDPSEATERIKVTLKDWIARHDAGFTAFLQTELARLRGEIVRAFEAKKALGAYAQTLQYRGG